jgi:tetratricopeptide (TPR) repeat protein
MFTQATVLFALLIPTMAASQAGTPTENATTATPSRQALSDLTHRAQKDFQNGRYRDAREKLRHALNVAPHDPALWTYMGLTDEQLNDLDSAIEDFQKALSIRPRDAQSHFNLGRVYRNQGNSSRSLEMYKQGLLLAPNDVAANQNYALLLMEAGKFREAIVPLQRLRKANGYDLSARATLIECYLKAGMPDEGRRDIQEFLHSADVHAEDKLKLAKLLLEDKFPEFAQPVLQQLAREAPNSIDAHATLGLLLLNQGHYDDASEQFKVAVRLAPQTPEYAMHLTECLILEQRYQEAFQFLNTIPQFGSLTEYRFKMGIVLYGMRHYSEALAVLEKLDREEPNLDLIQYYMANSYNEIGELEKAQAYARKAIALNSNQSSYHVVLAKILSKGGDTKSDEVLSNLERALALDPSNAEAKQELALFHEKKHDYRTAERLLKELVIQTPNVVSAHVILSRVYYEEHKREEGDAQRKVIEQLESQILGEPNPEPSIK